MSPENPEIADVNGFDGDEWIIQSDPEERNDAVEAIEQRLKVLEWDEKPIGDFSLAAAEAIANAIIHGNGGDINKKVEISLNLTKDMAEITVRDEGEVLKTSGRGILLMKQLCDEVEFNPGEIRILKRNNNGIKKEPSVLR